MSTAPTASGPTAILSMYMSGACNKLPWSAIAITARAFQPPVATMFVPSKGSTATSTRGPYPVPNFSRYIALVLHPSHLHQLQLYLSSELYQIHHA